MKITRAVRQIGFGVVLFSAMAWGQAPGATVRATQASSPAASKKIPAKITAGKLDWMFNTKRYADLERSLPAAELSAIDRQYFEGMLANLQNDLSKSIELLSKAAPELEEAHSPRAPRAMRLLGNSYVRAGRYSESAKVYKELVAKYADAFERGDKQSLEDDAATIALLDGAPTQSIDGPATWSVPWKRGKLGTVDVDATVNGVTSPWLVDTGANFSVLIESAAKRMNVKLSEKTAQTQGITGNENPLRVGIVPEMKLGAATVKNIAVVVLPDKNLNVNFGNGTYQIEAILGYPVLEALGRITVTTLGETQGELKIDRGGVAPRPDSEGSRMYIEELEPLLVAKISGRDVTFAFDTGADTSLFTSKYYNEFIGDLMNLPRLPHGVGGAGGTKKTEAVHQPKVRLEVGGTTDTLKDVPVMTERMGTHLDTLWGNLGRDLMNGFASFTIDFRSMRFELGAPASK